MPALSKKQQKFFGIVRSIQKGEQTPTTPETAKAASDMKKSDVKKFASTKHKGLPEKKKVEEMYNDQGNDKDQKQIDAKQRRANQLKKQVLMKKIQAVRSGAGSEIMASNNLEGEVIEGYGNPNVGPALKIARLIDKTKPGAKSKRTKISQYLKKREMEGDKKKYAAVGEENQMTEDKQIKKIVKQLRKSVKKHAKQADTLEKKIEEESNPRIPRKKGQPANSKKHSDLYTDENPKGTIHGLGFKDEASAKASVSKIRGSSRSHAHKIQAAVAMEQRAREMGKTSEAAIYRKFINTMKKKTKSMNEGSLHKWFKGSKSKDGKPGWVNVKTGGTCASDEPGEGTPKCVSSSKRASMSKSERDSASRRKKAADPGQQSKTGAAKPPYVSTDKKKMKKESFEIDKSAHKAAQKKSKMRNLARGNDNPNEKAAAEKKAGGPKLIGESDKKGKGSGTKDACYTKVKSRYSVWPSAYASGALVKCRKVGAANWGNSSKKEEFEPTGISFQQFSEKCWKGYEKKGMKTMFGKRYPNCVKKEEVEVTEGSEKSYYLDKEAEKRGREREARQAANKAAAKERAAQKRRSERNSLRRQGKTGAQGKYYVTKHMEKESVERDEYGDPIGGPKISKKQKAKNLAMNEPDKQHTTDTSEGMAYGITKGSGKPSGQMAAFGKKKKENPYSLKNKLKMVIKSVAEKQRAKAGVTSEEVISERQKDSDNQRLSQERGRSNYGKASVRNVRATGTGGNAADPAERLVAMDARHKAHKEKRGVKTKVKEEVGISSSAMITKAKKEAELRKKEQDAVSKKMRKESSNWRDEIELSEDDMKGMSVSSGHKRPTKSGAGMTQKGVEAYRRKNPGSKLKTAVTTEPSKLKKGSKSANRRKSYCARSAGQMKKFPKAAKDPDSRLRQARRRWNC